MHPYTFLLAMWVVCGNGVVARPVTETGGRQWSDGEPSVTADPAAIPRRWKADALDLAYGFKTFGAEP